MREKLKTWFLPWFSLVLNLVTALFWVALRINHSGISKFLGADTNPSFLVMNLPVMVCVLAWLSAVLALAGLIFYGKKKWPCITSLVLGLVFTGAALAVIAFGARDYLRFILVHFWRSMAVAGCIGVFALVLFFPISGGKCVKAGKALLLALVILGAVVIGYRLRPCELTYGAVVYAVEDTYQIVFSTSDNAIAWVEVDGECYYDLYAGSMRSKDLVHKVEVPQQVLDEAGGYTVCAKQMIYRGPFGGYTGELLSCSYSFRPVDSSDGLNYAAISDVHEAVAAATRASADARNDFVVLLGDLVSMVETEKDAQLANELAFAITGGEIPVIYARGNHEIKGEFGEDLYKYVGSKDQSYYYWVTLGSDVFAVVLDMGEDHPDDWWEYYGTARFTQYQQEQTAWLEEVLADGRYADYSYRMALCHIPFVYVDKNGYFEDTRLAWTRLVNEMGADVSLSGHKHVLWPMIPGMYPAGEELIYSEAYSGTEGKSDGGYLTDHRFPSFLVGRCSLQQLSPTQPNGGDEHTCMHFAADLSGGTQTAYYVNSDGETIQGVYPFRGGEETFREITVDLLP